MLRRKSITFLAAGMVSVLAVAAGCSPTPLTDVHKILSNAASAMQPDTNVMATTVQGKLESVHFVLDSGGQFLFGLEAAPSVEASATASAQASASASASVAPTASPTPLSSEAASASAAVASAAAASASAAAVASAAQASASAVAAEASASASAAVAASVTPSPTPTPYFTPVPFSLNNGHAEGDIDLVNKTAHITGWLTSIPGLSGELIVVDPYMYTRGYGATQYTLGYDSTLPVSPVATSGAIYYLNQILTIAADSRLSPTLVGTEQTASGPAYHVRVNVTPSVANDNLAASGQMIGSGTLELWILQDGFWVQQVEFSTSDPAAGTAAIRLVLSNFNGVKPILAPPDKQIYTSPAPSTTP